MKSIKEMSSEYLEYLNNHVTNVKNAFEWMKIHLFDKLDIEENYIDYTAKIIQYHDASKYSYEDEFFQYMNYFYDEERDKWLTEFNYAWLHHIHNNPHHWQYWVLYEDKENTALDMPLCYIIEMVCDWWSFSWRLNNLYEIFNWYKNHQDKILMSKTTKLLVENILDIMKEELDNEK